MKLIKASFIENKCEYYDTGGHADRKTNYIDRRINFILPEIAPGGFKIILNIDKQFILCVMIFASLRHAKTSQGLTQPLLSPEAHRCQRYQHGTKTPQ
jgi:hypothetical protein